MRIAHLVTVFPPYKSGIGNACYQQVIGLTKLGHEVTVFTPDYGRGKFEILNPKFETNPNDQNPKFKTIYLKPILKYGNAALVPGVTKELNNFDVIHLHYPFIGATEALLFSKIKKPLVIQYHMDLGVPKVLSFLIKPYNLLVAKNIFKKADKILVSSYDYVESFGPMSNFFKKNKEKFIEIPYGVDTEFFKPGEKNRDLLKKYNLLESDKIILFVGGLDQAHYFKGVSLLLEAVGNFKFQIPNFKLIIVGKGNLETKYEKMAENLGIKEKVIFTGEVSDNDLPDYYNLADIFVLPSINRSESFGIVLLEAMACGKPCIASNLPGVRTVVDDGETGFLVEPKNVDDLVKKIKSLLESENLLKKMGEAGRKKVEEKYNQNKIIKKIEEGYELLAKN